MKKENIALIGYGYWGGKLYKYLKDSTLYKLCYVYFPSLKSYSGKEINRQFGEEFVSDISLVWDDARVPNIVIATPIHTHFEVAMEAITHGKNILVEKPLTIKAQDAITLQQAAKQKNKIVETEYTYTYSKALRHAKKIIDDNVIGQIECIDINFKQLGRFVPFNVYLLLASHALSILDIFVSLDELDFSACPMIETDSVITAAVIYFKSRKAILKGHLDVSLHSPKKQKTVTIYGEKGTLVYSPDEKSSLAVTLYKRVKGLSVNELLENTDFFNYDENNNLKRALDNFYQIIQKKKQPNIQRSIKINKILELCSKKK